MASKEERKEFLGILDQYKMLSQIKVFLLNYLKDLLEKYPNDYLENSTIFKEQTQD